MLVAALRKKHMQCFIGDESPSAQFLIKITVRSHSICTTLVSLRARIIISTFHPSIHASYIPVKVLTFWRRTHHHTAQHSFAEFGQEDPSHKGLPHCIPEGKCVQGLIAVKTVSCSRIIVGLIDGEDPYITCRCRGQKHLNIVICVSEKVKFSCSRNGFCDIFLLTCQDPREGKQAY